LIARWIEGSNQGPLPNVIGHVDHFGLSGERLRQ
jgi:hypothetical protein